MNVIAYQQGRPGVLVAIPGEEPLREIAELLDCQSLEVTDLEKGLSLLEAADGEKRRLPIRYALDRLGRASRPVAGDCVVVARKQDGRMRTATKEDLETAAGYLRGV